MKRALFTGISGQDGRYLAQYLLDLGYEVFGLIRRDPQSVRWLGPILDRIETHVELDPCLMRTGEIHDLRGDASRTRSELGWAPTVDFRGLVRMMVAADLAAAGTTRPDPRPRG